uniref:Ras-related protein Rab-2A n=1 Tax=Heterorhabditis bacteriophora TaxID=37862 RepID=A0A1I7WP68_HETBA
MPQFEGRVRTYGVRTLTTSMFTEYLKIWDTAGQERFRSVTAAYYRDADALLLVYDVANRTSFENIRSWLAQVKEYGKETVQLTLVGNKCDLGSSRKVKSEEARHLASVSSVSLYVDPLEIIFSYNIPYIETSAKTGHNVSQAFTDIASSPLKEAIIPSLTTTFESY